MEQPVDQFAKETIPVSLEDEMRRSYLDYAHERDRRASSAGCA